MRVAHAVAPISLFCVGEAAAGPRVTVVPYGVDTEDFS